MTALRGFPGRLAAMVLVVLGSVLLFNQLADGPRKDPDRYYHFSISRMMVQDGVLDTLPQVWGLGWDRAFPDKEFLFHVFTWAGFRLGGDDGVVLAAGVLSLAALLLLLLQLSRWLPPWNALLVVLVVPGMSVPFLIRMALVRPHVLAVLAFVLLLLGLLQRRVWWCVVAGAAYALGYHAVYMPLAALGLAGLLAFRRDAALMRCALLGTAGLAAGLLLNPYFPANVTMGWAHLRIALNLDASAALDYGAELLPLRGDTWLSQHLLPVLLMAGAALASPWIRARETRDQDANTPAWLDVQFLLVTGGVFWLATLQNPRAVEYAIPCTTLLAGALLHPSNPLHGRTLVALLALGVVVGVPRVVRFAQAAPVPSAVAAATLEAAARIPASAAGSLIFNCEWERTPPILWARPDLRFVDVLDPTLLHIHNPALSVMRKQFTSGLLPDPHQVLREGLGARYVLCQKDVAIEQMENSAGFTRIYPDDYADVGRLPNTIFLYELLPAAIPQMVRALEIAPMPPSDSTSFRNLTPANAQDLVPVSAAPSPYVDLRTLPLPRTADSQTGCVKVTPAASEVARLAGASLVGLGGGRNVRLYVNGKPRFTSMRIFVQPRVLSILVPLERPLAATDTIEVLVCSGGSSPYHGVALSFWTRAQVDEHCRTKGHNSLDAPVETTRWTHTIQARTCLAPMAAPLWDEAAQP